MLALSACLFAARSVSAQEAVPVSLTYHVVAGCPSQSRFVERLKMHTQRVRLSEEPDALMLDVRVKEDGFKFAGRLEVTRSGSALGSRAFDDVDCREVVAALALSAALSIDPDATLALPAESDTPDSSSVSNAGEEPSPKPRPQKDASAGDTTSEPGAQQAHAGVELSTNAPAWSLGPLLMASFALKPKAALGGGLVLSVQDRTRSVFPLEFAVRARYLSTRPTRGDDPLRVDWWAADLQYCPVRAGANVALLFCSQFEAGAISAEGVGLEVTRQKTRTVFAAGLGLQGRLQLSDKIGIIANLDFTVPFTKRVFAVAPGPETIASSRPVGASVSLGALFGF